LKKKMPKTELTAFKKLILKKKEDIIEHIKDISEETVKKSQKDASGDISSYTYHMADVATDNYDREFPWAAFRRQGIPLRAGRRSEKD